MGAAPVDLYVFVGVVFFLSTVKVLYGACTVCIAL